MFLASFLGEEEAGGFDHDFRTHFVPFQFGRILYRSQANFFAIHDQRVAVHRDLTFEAAMHGIVRQHIGEVIRLEQVVNRNDLDVFEILYCCAEHHTSNAAKAIDTDFNSHF